MVRIYIANLGAYNRGELRGQWLTLPAEEEEIDRVIEEVLDTEQNDEEVAIHDWESEIKGLDVGEWEHIKTLNETLGEYESLQDHEQEITQAILEAGIWQDLQDAIDNHRNYNLLSHIKDAEELGEYWIQEFCDIPSWLENYIDYESYGEDQAQDGDFTSFGYLYRG